MTVDYEMLFADTPVVVAYLFGSRAEGRAHAQSDYDVGVLLPVCLATDECSKWRMELLGRLMDAYHADVVDVVILNEAPPLLRYEVIRHRHVLFNRDDEARVAFEVRTMQEWRDWEPRLRRLLRARMQRFAAGKVSARS